MSRIDIPADPSIATTARQEPLSILDYISSLSFGASRPVGAEDPAESPFILDCDGDLLTVSYRLAVDGRHPKEPANAKDSADPPLDSGPGSDVAVDSAPQASDGK